MQFCISILGFKVHDYKYKVGNHVNYFQTTAWENTSQLLLVLYMCVCGGVSFFECMFIAHIQLRENNIIFTNNLEKFRCLRKAMGQGLNTSLNLVVSSIWVSP